MKSISKFFSLSTLILLVLFLGLRDVQPAKADDLLEQTNTWGQLVGPGLYVSAQGDDQGGANSCSNAASPCRTIQQAVTKAASGDTIYVASGTFNGSGASPIVTINKNLSISGGWDGAFDTQTSLTILDGQDIRSDVVVNTGVTASIEKFIVTNSKESGIKNLGTLTVQYSMIHNNDKPYPDVDDPSASDGGGIHNTGTLVVENTAIYGHTANSRSGGGIFNTGSLTVTNSTIANNFALHGGGIMYTPTGYAGTSPSVVLNNVTIKGNSGPHGSGIYRAANNEIILADPVLHNSIMANNTCHGAITAANNNLIYQSSGCTINGSLTTNPLLGTFSTANGYFPLLRGSPAIDAGSTSTPGSGGSACEAVDQLGTTRPTDGNADAAAVCDIGAYETDPSVAGLSPVANAIDVDNGSLQSTEIASAFSDQLSALVTDQFGNPISGVTVTFTAPSSSGSGTFGDSGTNTTTAITDIDGIATADIFTANATIGSYPVNASVLGIPNLVQFLLTNTDAASSMVVTDGSLQSVELSTVFPNRLSVLVEGQSGDPLSGITVTFTAPASGASGTFGDSGTNTTTATTNENGIAIASVFTANAVEGSYAVNASVSGIASPLQLQLENVTNLAFYVSPSGNDLNACTFKAAVAACKTINAALTKAMAGDTINIAIGTYTSSSSSVATINKSTTLLGGWDTTFTTQSGMSTLDGQGARRVINIDSNNAVFNVIADHLIIQHGNHHSGGGIYDFKHSLTLNNSVVKDNVADSGGGIYSFLGSITLNNTIVSGNLGGDACCTGGGGGGGINIAGGTLVLNNSTVSMNKLVGGFEAAGILNSNSNVTLNNSTVSWNIGGYAIHNDGTLTLNNSTVNDNAFGGIATSGDDITLNNSTVSGNLTGIACTSSCGGQVVLKNSILANNKRDCIATISSGGYNLIGNMTGCSFSPILGDLTNVDAKLGQFVGQPGYLPLLAQSPAINAGNPATCLAADQRGVARPQNGTCDIGAYEYTVPGSAAAIMVVDGTSQRAAPGTKFFEPFTVAVLDNQGSPVSGATVTFTAPLSGASGAFVDSGTNTTTSITNTNGIATVDMFIANSISGNYLVSATVNGAVASADFMLTNLGWFVSTTGNDANSCNSAVAPCLTINAALGKAAVGDPIYVAEGTYLGTGENVISITKSVSIFGGWNINFTAQNGMSIIDGGKARRGINLQSDSLSVVNLDHFIIQNGSSSSGSGISNKGAALTLNHSILRYNLSSSKGGGIYNLTGMLTINDTALTENLVAISGCCDGGGAGIYNDATMILNNSNVSRNTITSSADYSTSNGSGIYNGRGYISDSILLLNNSTVSNNISKAGIYSSGNFLHLNNSTVSNHVYGIDNNNSSRAVILQNSILAGNTSDDCDGDILSFGYNLIGNTTDCDFSSHVSDLTNVNARLGQLIGFPGYIPLLSDSPAINAGNPATCLATDERGVARPQGGGCDIGAYEYTVPGSAASIRYFEGSNQSGEAGGAYAVKFAAYVMDSVGSPVPGVMVNFTAPSSGSSGTFADTQTSTTTAVTNANGIAIASTFAANNTPGSYNVSATLIGLPDVVTFALTNLPIPAPLSPIGSSLTTKPTYQWGKVTDATEYKYELWDGATLVYSKTVAANVCAITTCSDTPTYKLKHFLHSWRVSAMVAGVWKGFSGYGLFNVAVQPGFWNKPGVEFYIAPNQTSVKKFAIYIYVYGCGSYKITNKKTVPITNNRFAFSGKFHASGTFTDPTHVSGKLGLKRFLIPGCGIVSGGPFSWKAIWKNKTQPKTFLTAEVVPLLATESELQAAASDYFTVERVGP